MCAYQKIHGIYCVRRAEERGCVVFLGTALFFSLQNGQTGPISLLSLSDHFGEIFPTRVSSDNPRLKAFCRVAPSVLFNLRAISAARLLLRASFVKVRICSAVNRHDNDAMSALVARSDRLGTAKAPVALAHAMR